MDFIFVLLLLTAGPLLILYLAGRRVSNPDDQRASARDSDCRNTEGAARTPHVSHDRYDDPDVKIIRDDIRAAVASHAAAVSLLQAMCRIDGVSSESERTMVFEFLRRRGCALDYERHRPWFYTSRSGEWYRQATRAEIDALISKVTPLPLSYRIDIVATASAIVYSGGTPRKREAEALMQIKTLTAEQPSIQPG